MQSCFSTGASESLRKGRPADGSQEASVSAGAFALSDYITLHKTCEIEISSFEDSEQCDKQNLTMPVRKNE